MKKPKKEKRGGTRKGAGRPRNLVQTGSLRISLPLADIEAITGLDCGYQLAREALQALAFQIRNPDLPPQA